MQVAKAGDGKSPLLDMSAQVVISTSLVQIQPYSLHILYGSVSGIGNAADCKSVASAFLVRVQGGPPLEGQPQIRGSCIVMKTHEHYIILAIIRHRANGLPDASGKKCAAAYGLSVALRKYLSWQTKTSEIKGC